MDRYIKLLSTWSKSTISLDDLLTLFYQSGQSYEQMADIILQLENKKLLQSMKSAGRTTRHPPLAYRYRIDKAQILQEFHTLLHHYNQQFHSAIRLDSYYTADRSQFETDLPYLKKLDCYLKTKGFPEELVPAPERSVELVGDEKWIDEKGGQELLERVGLWDRLAIVPVSDPLMFAVNRNVLHNETQYHLIVENKTTYQALLPQLVETNFSTLIYGAGNKIVKSIEQFDWQLSTEDSVQHRLYYFGDIDRAGINIWHLLKTQRQVLLAIPFYKACLVKTPLNGKVNQRKDREALNAFVKEWKEGHPVEGLLENGQYYPQEILTSTELRHIWRDWSWHLLNGKV